MNEKQVYKKIHRIFEGCSGWWAGSIIIAKILSSLLWTLYEKDILDNLDIELIIQDGENLQ